jgi:hypothetical protein
LRKLLPSTFVQRVSAISLSVANGQLDRRLDGDVNGYNTVNLPCRLRPADGVPLRSTDNARTSQADAA